MLERKQLLAPLLDEAHEAAQEIERFASEVFGNIQVHRCLARNLVVVDDNRNSDEACLTTRLQKPW